MTINLADNTPRVSYAVAAGVTQSSFTVSFEFFDDADLNVYVDGTLKTLTTDYTVTGGDGATGSITMSVTGAAGGSTVVITRDIDLKRTTDFPASGAFQVGSLNTELDKLVAIAADLDDKASRALQLTDYDSAVSLVLPDVDTRKGKTLAFNASTGAVESGPSITDVQTVSAASADIATLADIEDGTDATDAIQTVAGISANVTTVAGVSANVTTVAGISSDVTAVAGDATDIGTVATNIANVNTVAGNDANITTVAGISANVTTVAGDSADIQAVAADATDIGTVATNIADVNTAATNITAIQNASTNAATATTKAAEASTSATNASTSATNAATSATAAAASQTAAAASAASAASAFDNFDDTYLGSKTADPTVDNDGDPLTEGDLYFNTTANEMRVYDGANWIAATSAGNVSLILYEYTATAGQTTFSGSDDNSATLSYTADNLQVVMNGIVLDPSDFTATNGTSVVLATGAALNDIVNIYAFKSFTTADMVSASAGGTFSGNVTVNARLDVDNIRIDGNTISSTDTNGDITLDPNGTGSVAITGGFTATDGCTITTADNDAQLSLVSTDADSNFGPKVSLYRNSASPADDDFLGIVEFDGENDAGETVTYAQLFGRAHDVTDGTEDGRVAIKTMINGTSQNVLDIIPNEFVINQDSQDIDFRVESDNKNEALFVRGSDGHIGIGTSAPTNPLYVQGDNDEGTIRIHSNILNQSGKYNGIIFSGESSHSKVGIFQVSDVLSYNKTKLVFATNSGNNSNNVTPSDARLTIANGGNVIVHGAFSKGSGSFRIDHPLPAKNSTHELVHSFIEGPQADLIYRGKVDLVAGSATVNIDTAAGMTDGTFVLLCGDVQCFTSNEDGFTAVKGSVSGNTLTITAEDNTCTDTISWMVIGERKDQHMIDTEWTDDNGKVIVEPLKEAAE